ncbi:MAG: hypothetical protein WCG87_04215, partial [Bacteroidota bacterium]
FRIKLVFKKNKTISIYSFSKNITPVHNYLLIHKTNSCTNEYKVLGDLDSLDVDIAYIYKLFNEYEFNLREKALLYDYIASDFYLKWQLNNAYYKNDSTLN